MRNIIIILTGKANVFLSLSDIFISKPPSQFVHFCRKILFRYKPFFIKVFSLLLQITILMSLLYHNDTIIKKEKELLRALLIQFCKLEVDEPTDYYFSLTLSSRISGRA